MLLYFYVFCVLLTTWRQDNLWLSFLSWYKFGLDSECVLICSAVLSFPNTLEAETFQDSNVKMNIKYYSHHRT